MMPTVRSLISRVFSPLRRAVEGQPRSGPHYLPISGGWLPASAGIGWWQEGHSLLAGDRSAVVERCINLYAETIASLPGTHWQANNRGGRERVKNSALSRILRKPNDYQTIANFMLNVVRQLYSEGNAYVLGIRNARFEVDEIHLMNARQSRPQVSPTTGDVIYRLGGNDIISQRVAALPDNLRTPQLLVPERDVLHISLNASGSPWPLVGEPPLVAAMADIALSNAFAEQQMNFLKNQSRPSAVLSTDMVLDKAQTQALRDRWNEQSKALSQGGVPILSGGLKVMPWNVPAKDAQLAELMRLSAERICLAFGIPLQLLGLGGAPYSTTESLMRLWLANSLGFALALVEQSFDRFFGLEGEPDEWCEFSTDALLRSDPKDRIEMLARGVQSGIYSPNEARAAENLDAVPFGDEPRVQAQVIPLSAASGIPSAPSAPSAPAAETATYRNAVEREIAALRTRNARRSQHTAPLNGAGA
jgi:HK97 family phage portal protein